MATMRSFAGSVWTDMLDLYAQAGVPELCLKLQDTYDVDVPVLLLLLLADRSGLYCSAEDFQRFLDGAEDWRERVVRPLRTIRRAMRTQPMTAEEAALRNDVKRIELQAEKLHVARLVAVFPAQAAGHGALAERYLADRGMPEKQRSVTVGLFEQALTKSMPNHLQNN